MSYDSFEFVLQDLKYAVVHRPGIDGALGVPVHLHTTSMEYCLAEMKTSGLHIAMHPNGDLLERSNAVPGARAMRLGGPAGAERRWAVTLQGADRVGHAVLAVGAAGDILLNARYPMVDADDEFVGAGYAISVWREPPSGAASPELRWQYRLPNRRIGHGIVEANMGSPVIADDAVYLSHVQLSGDGGEQASTVTAISLADGRLKWAREYPGKYIGQLRLLGDRALYASFRAAPSTVRDGGVVELSMRDGGERRILARGAPYIGMAAADDGTVYALTGKKLASSGHWRALALHKLIPVGTGYEQQTLFTFPADFESAGYHPALIIGSGRRIYFAGSRVVSGAGRRTARASEVYAFKDDGTVSWRHFADGDICGVPALAVDGTLYFSLRLNPSADECRQQVTQGEIRAVCAESGEEEWHTVIGDVVADVGNGDPLLTSPLITADGIVYVAAMLAKKTLGGQTYNGCVIGLRARKPMPAARVGRI
ncbi:hypothetical protein [Chromobacterium sp. ATCC 53434]|uniref:outer membrane protein assembly factor BamB family protein n=1 Tax=Chromobacterium sp. (strain ATCC 53434 / SC 14030) TaxID=2059672 RepID=UPI0013051D1B|nr:hypothetical protein [Chromobacterium sp. ATCC 53434]